MSHNLECLCYTGLDSSGRRETVYYSNIAGLSQEEIEVKANALRLDGKQEVRALSWEDCYALQQEESKVKYNVNKPTLVDLERFDEMRDVLPPHRWNSDYEQEIFMVSECITGDIYSFYVRLGRGENAKYFEVNASISASNSEIFELCNAA